MLTGYPAGGLVDVTARMLVEGMKSRFPKGLVLQIKPGAAGSVAVTELSTRRTPKSCAAPGC
jgi:tripartite-type tricarboxylate transporter receptor subunit TctC